MYTATESEKNASAPEVPQTKTKRATAMKLTRRNEATDTGD